MPSSKVKKFANISHEPKVAIVHYWMVSMRGGEAVVEALCRMFPSADIFTHVYESEKLSSTILKHDITTTFISRLPWAKRRYPSYLPLMPIALEGLDLTGYDLIISSEAGPAKGVITAPGSLHVCYTHSPMRYVWDQYYEYRKEAGWLTRLLMPLMTHYLRSWDVTTAARVDGFMANSTHVAKRIKKYYRRDAVVVAPPVAVDQFEPVRADDLEEFYLWAGELVMYKCPNIAIDAFTLLDKPLVVIGGGTLPPELIARAGNKITFLGRVPHAVLKDHMSKCRALVFPGEEDFGIVPLEVMASGRPVIAYGKGGALDTVIDGLTGLLFYEKSVDGLVEAVQRFECTMLASIDPEVLVAHARKFDEQQFQNGISEFLKGYGFEVDTQIEDEVEFEFEPEVELEPSLQM